MLIPSNTAWWSSWYGSSSSPCTPPRKTKPAGSCAAGKEISRRKRRETGLLQERAASRFVLVAAAPQRECSPASSRLLLRSPNGPSENVGLKSTVACLWMHLEGQDSRGRRHESVG